MKFMLIEWHAWAGTKRILGAGYSGLSLGWVTVVLLQASLLPALHRLRGLLAAEAAAKRAAGQAAGRVVKRAD